MHDFVTTCVMHLMSILFVKYVFTGIVWVQKEFLAKSGDKRTIQTFVEVLYIFSLWSKFKAFLPSLVWDWWARWTLQKTIRNNTSIKYHRKQVCKSYFKRLDVIKIKERSVLKELEEEFQRCTAQRRRIIKHLSTPKPRFSYWTLIASQEAVLNAFSSPEPAILLACGRNRELWEHRCRLRETGWAEFGYFLCISKWLLPELSIPVAGQKDRRLWGRECLKHSCCVGERMRASPNQLLN